MHLLLQACPLPPSGSLLPCCSADVSRCPSYWTLASACRRPLSGQCAMISVQPWRLATPGWRASWTRRWPMWAPCLRSRCRGASAQTWTPAWPPSKLLSDIWCKVDPGCAALAADSCRSCLDRRQLQAELHHYDWGMISCCIGLSVQTWCRSALSSPTACIVPARELCCASVASAMDAGLQWPCWRRQLCL